MNSLFWQKQVYRYVFYGCGLFVLLTVTAYLGLLELGPSAKTPQA